MYEILRKQHQGSGTALWVGCETLKYQCRALQYRKKKKDVILEKEVTKMGNGESHDHD